MRLGRLSPQILATAGALGLLAVVAVLTSHCAEPAYDPFASTDYRGGGLRAWSALLAREGVTTGRFLLRPIELDARTDTLISAQPTRLVAQPAGRTRADLGALAAWVRHGGRLVYLGRDADLRAEERHLFELPAVAAPLRPRGALSGPAAVAIRAVAGLGPDRMVRVGRADRTVLADGRGAIVVRRSLGAGEVIAVVDAGPFTNANLARADNARLAYLLGLPRRSGGLVAFDDGLHGALIDRPWYRALPSPVRLSLAIATVAGGLGLAGSMLRGGAAFRLDAPREPSSAEFVDAVAALYERAGARTAARDVLARDALATAARGAGVPADTPVETLVARLGDGPVSRAAAALVRTLDVPVANDRELLASARLASIVRKESTNDGIGDRRRSAFAGRDRTRRRR